MDNQELINRLKTPVFDTLCNKCDYIRQDMGILRYAGILSDYYNFVNIWVLDRSYKKCQKYKKERTIHRHLCIEAVQCLSGLHDLRALTDYQYQLLFNPAFLDLGTIERIHQQKEFVENY